MTLQVTSLALVHGPDRVPLALLPLLAILLPVASVASVARALCSTKQAGQGGTSWQSHATSHTSAS